MALLELLMPFKSHDAWAVHWRKQVQSMCSAVTARRRPVLDTDDVDDGKGAARTKIASDYNQQGRHLKKAGSAFPEAQTQVQVPQRLLSCVIFVIFV